MMAKFLKNKYFPLLLLLILILPAIYFFLKPGIYWNMHDDMQMIRQLEFEKCLKDGQIPCRWTPDLGYLYGYPLFNYYPPLPYIVGQTFRVIGLSFLSSVKLTALVQVVLAAFFMYLLCRQITKPLNSILGALFYTYGPYHAVNVYTRGAMNEAWASVFFPLVFLFSLRFILKNKTLDLILLGISFALILLSHNPMALIITPFLGIWAFYWLHLQYQFDFKKYIPILFKLLFSGLVAVSLSAFFTLPVILENNLVQIDSMFQGYYNYSVHFISLYQLFISNFWGDGPSVWGTEDGMSFSVGYLHWIVPLIGFTLSTFLIITKKIKLKNAFLFFLISAFALFSAFLTHQKSSFIWQNISTLQKIQFPWRFLNLSNFFFSFSVAIILNQFIKSFPKVKYFSIALALLVILINFQKFYPITSGPITDEQKFSGLAWNNQITSGIYDYLPKTAPTAAKRPAEPYLDVITPSTVKYEITGQKKGTDWLFYNLNLNSEATITLPVLAFPNFKLFDYGKQISYFSDPELGRISTNLSAGNHQLYLKLYNTPIRSISNYLSLLSWLAISIYIFFTLWNKRKSLK